MADWADELAKHLLVQIHRMSEEEKEKEAPGRLAETFRLCRSGAYGPKIEVEPKKSVGIPVMTSKDWPR